MITRTGIVRFREDYTTYTEVDVGENRVSIAANKITVTDLDDDEAVYVYKDFGSNYFSGDFRFELDFNCTDGDSACGLWMLSQDIGTAKTLWDANKNNVFLMWSAGNRLFLYSKHGIDSQSDFSDVLATDGTDYYLRIRMDRVSATVTCKIYSDASRETLVDSLSTILEDATDQYQYLYAMQGNCVGDTGITWDGEIRNLIIL